MFLQKAVHAVQPQPLGYRHAHLPVGNGHAHAFCPRRNFERVWDDACTYDHLAGFINQMPNEELLFIYQ